MKKFLKKTGIGALVLALIGGILWGILHKQNPRDTVTSYTGMKVDVEKMAFYLKNDKISGRIYRPVQDSTDRMPAVIYCPSLGKGMDAGDTFCKGAAGKGYVGFSFDFRGGSRSSSSTGLMPAEMTLSTEIEDLKAVIKGVKALRYVDKKNVFLIGEGFGGVVVSALAAEKPEICNSIILVSPDLNYSDLISERFPRTRDIPDTLQTENTIIGKKFIREMKRTDTKSLLHGYPKEYLIFDGQGGHAPVFTVNEFIGNHLR
ncbi:MAG: alpha/beta fold hydrolase [Bacteroidales bacterium]|nr:alpha/beta fold hydrolase [Bacteroidales bacterium]